MRSNEIINHLNYKEKMKHLFIVTLFSILHLNYGFKAFQNVTGIEKAKYDIAKLLEIQHVFKRRIKRQAQVKLDYPLTNNHHRPKNPQFKKLMKQMNNIIPAQIVNPDFIQSTQNILKDLRSEKLNDVQLNLKDGTHRAFHKPNSTPIYIDVGSNHPEIIKKRLPGMIGKRLSKLCSTKESFDQEKVLYQEALKKSGHKEELQYVPAAAAATKRRRQRKVIYFCIDTFHSTFSLIHCVAKVYAVLPFYDVKCLCSEGRE